MSPAVITFMALDAENIKWNLRVKEAWWNAERVIMPGIGDCGRAVLVA